MFFIARRSPHVEQRRRAMAWVTRLTWLQEVPGIALVLLTGVAMAVRRGPLLLDKPWFRAELVLLLLLFASGAVFIHHPQSRLARRFARSSPLSVTEEEQVSRLLRWIVVGGVTSFASVIAIVILSVGKTVAPPAVWLLVPVALAIGAVFLFLISRAATEVREVLPDA